jgi:hypothetical protein
MGPKEADGRSQERGSRAKRARRRWRYRSRPAPSAVSVRSVLAGNTRPSSLHGDGAVPDRLQRPNEALLTDCQVQEHQDWDGLRVGRGRASIDRAAICAATGILSSAGPSSAADSLTNALRHAPTRPVRPPATGDRQPDVLATDLPRPRRLGPRSTAPHLPRMGRGHRGAGPS